MTAQAFLRALTPMRTRGTDEVFPTVLAYGDIAICIRDNGSPWLLGTGAHGKVRSSACSHIYRKWAGHVPAMFTYLPQMGRTCTGDVHLLWKSGGNHFAQQITPNTGAALSLL